MSANQSYPWLDRLYRVALFVHGTVLMLLGLVALWVIFGTRTADSAPDLGAGALLVIVVQLVWLVPLGLLSAIVFVSRRFARRLGHEPSPVHRGLAVAGALPLLVGMLWVATQ